MAKRVESNNGEPDATKVASPVRGDGMGKRAWGNPATRPAPIQRSGRMLLAAAACYPAYAVHLGLVRFYAADIDPLCVAMARTNVLLYGLNGTGLRYAQALAQANAEAMPPLEAARGPVQSLDSLTAEPAVSSRKKKPRRARRPTPPALGLTPAQRARKSILVMDDPTPEKIMAAVQLDLFDWSSAGGVTVLPKTPDSLLDKQCVVCQVSPQARPGTWYMIDGEVYCPKCVPAVKAGEQRETVEVGHG
jgi:hypothetical protein